MTAKLKFIVGRSGTGKTYCSLKAIANELKESPLVGETLVLLVPEHLTHKRERELANMAGGGFIRAKVYGFRRFAYQILQETGQGKVNRLSQIGRHLLLREVLHRRLKAGEIESLAKIASKQGFIDSLNEIIKEIKSYRLSPEALAEIAALLKDKLGGRLPGKIAELSLLMSDFASATEGKVNDEEDMMSELARAIPLANSLHKAKVWLDGFTFFNPQEKEILAALMKVVSEINITLTLGGIEINGGKLHFKASANIAQTSIFYRTYDTMQMVKKLWYSLGSKESPEVEVLPENVRFLSPCLKVVESQLCGMLRHVPQVQAKESAIRLVEAANQRLEVEAVAADILRLVRKGWHWRDIGVLVRDAEAYEDIIKLVFSDYGITHFFDGKRQSINHPMSELLRSSLEVIEKNWSYETVFRTLRTGFFPLTREEVDILENYVLEFGLRGKRVWQQEKAWSWWRRRSLADEEVPDEKIAERLVKIDSFRKRIALPLVHLETNLKKADTVHLKCVALYDYLVELDVPSRLTEWQKIAEEDGRLSERDEHHHIWAGVMEFLEQLTDVSGTEKISVKEFRNILEDGFSFLQIALIPPGIDYVSVASFDQNSLDNSRAIYILGVNAGTMPRMAHSSGLLSDADRLYISEALHDLDDDYEGLHTSLDRTYGERFLLYRGFTEAREYLWVSSALADSQGKSLMPAEIFLKLRRLMPENVFLSIPLEILERSDDLLLSAVNPAFSHLATALQGVREGKELEPLWQDVYNWLIKSSPHIDKLKLLTKGLFAKANDEKLPQDLAKALYTKGKYLQGSVTRFEMFQRCPFQHFAKYGLKLEERREREFNPPALGEFVHEVLYRYGQIVAKDYANKWASVPSDKRQIICEQLIEKIAPRLQGEVLISRSDYKNLVKRIMRTCLFAIDYFSAWSEMSDFCPLLLEASFGHKGDIVKLTPISLSEGMQLKLTGKIDRLDIDKCNKYFLIIDYKTGAKDISVSEIYHGLQLQLLTYLLVGQELVKKEGKKHLTAGVLYAFVKQPFVINSKGGHGKFSAEDMKKKAQELMKMSGLVLSEADAILAIEHEGSGRFVKAQVNSDLKVKQTDNVKTKDEFEILTAYAKYLLNKTGEDILAGDIKTLPIRKLSKQKETACTYCAFSDVCGFDVQLDGCRYKELSVEDDSVLMQEMATLIGETL